MWKKLSDAPLVQLKFLIFAVLVAVANWLWWLLQAKDRALAHQATESQLRMLQAQIEPHFLFNTLANVQSLIRSDPQRAQLMLESFTDYLRASMVQMRESDISLDVELETVRSYLQLMQIRMGRRLQFVIDADAAACRAMLPPLLVQPLVENAVHHGLEGKLGGGSVRLSASVHDGVLEIRVDDDGLGLEGAPGGKRGGAGVALKNIRARLQTRYGSAASLRIAPCDEGVCATLTVPYRPGAVQQPAQAVQDLPRPVTTA
jgi:LytS/YehU family sensor histidine kinase